jgi:hypothetical protein
MAMDLIAGFLEVDGDGAGGNEHITLTKMQSDTLRRLWASFGPDEIGTITHQDLKAGLTLLGLEKKSREMLQRMDAGGLGRVTVKDFMEEALRMERASKFRDGFHLSGTIHHTPYTVLILWVPLSNAEFQTRPLHNIRMFHTRVEWHGRDQQAQLSTVHGHVGRQVGAELHRGHLSSV